MTSSDPETWCPFRPTAEQLDQIGKDVAPVREVQQTMLDHDDDLKQPDRVAHQYQIGGGQAILEVADGLPAELDGVGLFEPGARHLGIGRFSTGLGVPHPESNPDFLGFLLAFETRDGKRVDFIGINDPAAPTDDHHVFMDLLQSTGESVGAKLPFLSHLGESDLGDLIAEQTAVGRALIERRGLIQATETLAHVGGQTLRTVRSSTVYQTYWTGILEVGRTAGKFLLVPQRDENRFPGLHPGERHFTDEWRQRQAAGDVVFFLDWMAYRDERSTPTVRITEPWKDGERARVGTVTFPRSDFATETARLWAALASEIGGNPGHWIHDRGDTIREPATEFGTARKLAYTISQEGRSALDPAFYHEVFASGEIGPELAAELRRRREAKEREGHVSWSPE